MLSLPFICALQLVPVFIINRAIFPVTKNFKKKHSIWLIMLTQTGILPMANTLFFKMVFSNLLICFGVNSMYSFHAYKLMADLLAVYGIDMPINPDRSTLHRWRASGRVPGDTFRLVYYYSRCAFQDYALDIDLHDVFETCGFTTEGLC